MFKKKKQIPIIHYEGIDIFYQNCPCTLEDKDNFFEIIREKDKCTITLNTNQIQFIDYLSESEFMQKYHNTNSFEKSNKKYFIIHFISKEGVTKRIVFWATSFESKQLISLKYKYSNRNNESYSL